LLARANVDAPAVAHSIAGLNTTNTFQPLNPLHDTDVAGFLRHTHEQTLISVIEESRRQAELDFYENINHRMMKDWEARKRKIFEELGVPKGVSSADGANREGEARLAGQKAAMRSKSAFEASVGHSNGRLLEPHANGNFIACAPATAISRNSYQNDGV
jgi:nuclear pore complex protein Nup93